MTRREKFLKMRARFMHRRRQARSINSVWSKNPLTGGGIRLGYSIQWTADGIQSPQSANPGPFEWTDFLPPGYPAGTFVLSPAGYRQPPHVTITGPFKRPGPLLPSSNDEMIVGMHRRRVQRWKRKPNRLSKRDRAIWLANMFAWQNGGFPPWDPLQRHPNDEDINNGHPLIDEFPYYW